MGRSDRVGAWVRGGRSRGWGGGGVGRLALLRHHLWGKVGTKEKDRASGRSSRSWGGKGKWREGGGRRGGRLGKGRHTSLIKRLTAPGDRQGGRAGLTSAPFLLLVFHLSCPGLLVAGYQRRMRKVVEDGNPVRRQTRSQRR